MSADAAIHRWTGGASWPWFILRFNATWPLAVLELSGTMLTLRDRFLWSPLRLITLSYVVLTPAEVRVVFPCRRFAQPHQIAIVTTGGEVFEFFRPGRRSAILGALAEAGFPVTWKERTGLRIRDWFESQSEPD
jgi:hypothetical protein